MFEIKFLVKKEVRGPYRCKALAAEAGEGLPRLTIFKITDVLTKL